MSGSLKSALTKQYKAAFARWPKDHLRPDVQLQDVLNHHLAERLAGARIGASDVTDIAIERATGRPPVPPPQGDLAQLQQVNALFALLGDRYKTQNPLPPTGTLLTPRSNPTYYQDLLTELEEAPTRSFLGRVRKRLGGMFRLS